MKKTLIATTLATMVIVAVAAVGTTVAGPRRTGDVDGPGGMRAFGTFMQLDLTEEQNGVIRGILDAFRPRIKASKSAIGSLRAEMKQVVKDFGFNDALLTPIAEAIGAATTEATLIRAEMGASMREVLTEKQLELLESIRDERGGLHDGFVGRGR